MDVTAKKAIALRVAGTATTREQATQSQIEFVGVPVRGLTRFQNAEPGNALSRLKA
jgi:hypothetical protein